MTPRTQNCKTMWQYELPQLEGENTEFAKQESRKLQDNVAARYLSNECQNKFKAIMTEVIKYDNG